MNITFTVLDEGQKARADSGNHLIAILQSPVKYEHLKCGLDNICKEVKSTTTLEVDEENYTIEFFLGGMGGMISWLMDSIQRMEYMRAYGANVPPTSALIRGQ